MKTNLSEKIIVNSDDYLNETPKDSNKIINTGIGLEDSEQNNINNVNALDTIDSKDRTCFQRYFSKMESGSLRSSVFNLSIVAIGTGCLALPQRFGQLGIVLCTIEIIVAIFSTYWTLNLLVNAARKKNLTNYSLVVLEYCGPYWAICFDIVIIIYVFGCLVTYQIIIYKLIGSFVYMLFYLDDFKNLDSFYDDSFWNRREIKICHDGSCNSIFTTIKFIKEY